VLFGFKPAFNFPGYHGRTFGRSRRQITWNSLLVLWDQYHGLIIGFAVLALVLVANQLIFRRFWTSYPTREAYLAAHPGCDTANGIVCATCRQKASEGPVAGRGRIYRCGWCETELYRVDKA
jgi:hypothetical protein